MIFSCCKKKPTIQSKQPTETEYDSLLEELSQTYKKLSIEAPRLRAITLAQWLLESGRATSNLSTLHYNFAGLKWRDEMTGFASVVSYEAHDGRTDYCKFDSVEKFVRGYWTFIDRDPYEGWRKYSKDPHGFMEHLVRSGYCPDNGYINQVFSLEKEAENLLIS